MSYQRTRSKRAHSTWMKDGNTLHIETELGIVNIHLGLHDMKGRKVESVELLPDKTDHLVLIEEKEAYLRVRMIEVKP